MFDNRINVYENVANSYFFYRLEKARIENKIGAFEKLKNRYDDLMTLIDLCLEENSNEELKNKFRNIHQRRIISR